MLANQPVTVILQKINGLVKRRGCLWGKALLSRWHLNWNQKSETEHVRCGWQTCRRSLDAAATGALKQALSPALVKLFLLYLVYMLGTRCCPTVDRQGMRSITVPLGLWTATDLAHSLVPRMEVGTPKGRLACTFWLITIPVSRDSLGLSFTYFQVSRSRCQRHLPQGGVVPFKTYIAQNMVKYLGKIYII